MTDASANNMVHRPQLSFLDKTATLSSWAIAGAVFLTLGWMAMAPDDPYGPVSALARSGSLMMILQASALAAVTAGIATVIAGRRLADVGTFAAAVGLAVVSLKGSTTTYLLLVGMERSAAFEHALALRFAVEAIGWFVVLMIALLASSVVMRWCHGGAAKADESTDDLGLIAARSMAGYDVPGIPDSVFGVPAAERTPPTEGLKHAGFVTVAGVAAMAVLSAGLTDRSVQHGQACFVVVAAIGMATYIAHRLAPVRSSLWSILGVLAIALVGYAWAGVRPVDAGSPAGVPSSHFLRVLPIQYIAVGVATAVAMFWSHDEQVIEPPPPAPRPARPSTARRRP